MKAMKELIGTLIAKADLDQEKATKVAEVVKNFLTDKLPAPLQGPVLNAISGDSVESVASQAKNVLGKLF